jgi:predicted ATPase
LRSTFDVDVLRGLLESMDFVVDPVGLIRILEACMSEGLLDNLIGSSKYKFVHDRIQQAAVLLVKGDEKDRMSLYVGKHLIALSTSPSAEDWMLFAAADHLNTVDIHILQEEMPPLALVELNLEAGERAASLAAFSPAAEYHRNAVELLELDEMRWENHYDLCLKLYSSAAEIQFCMGSFDRGQYLTQEVLMNARCPTDKLRAYTSLADGLGQSERHKDALDIYCKALDILGEMPKGAHPIQALRQLYVIKSVFQKMTDAEILSLPRMTDKSKLTAMDVLSKTSVRSFFCTKKFLALCCTMRMLRLTLQYGLCATSAVAVSSYAGLLIGPFKEVELGRRLGNLALQLTVLTNAKEYEARILFNAAR